TADKISLVATLTSHGTSTHASMPRPDNAIYALARALAKLSDHETDVMLLPSTRKFFLTLARTSTGPIAAEYRNLLSDDPALVRQADREISKDPLLHALIRNTIAPVLINGGFRANVIPGSAEATVNIRIIPGVDPQAIIREIQTVIADPSIDVKLGGTAMTPDPISSDTTALFPGAGDPCAITTTTNISVDASSADLARIAESLALVLRPSTGFAIPVSTSATGNIALRVAPDRGALGAEGYDLTVTRDSVRIV